MTYLGKYFIICVTFLVPQGNYSQFYLIFTCNWRHSLACMLAYLPDKASAHKKEKPCGHGDALFTAPSRKCPLFKSSFKKVCCLGWKDATGKRASVSPGVASVPAPSLRSCPSGSPRQVMDGGGDINNRPRQPQGGKWHRLAQLKLCTQLVEAVARPPSGPSHLRGPTLPPASCIHKCLPVSEASTVPPETPTCGAR